MWISINLKIIRVTQKEAEFYAERRGKTHGNCREFCYKYKPSSFSRGVYFLEVDNFISKILFFNVKLL